MSGLPRIAVFVSGGGRSLENLAVHIATHQIMMGEPMVQALSKFLKWNRSMCAYIHIK